MNILFVLYGDFGSNSAHPMAIHARELSRAGHHCAAAVPFDIESFGQHAAPSFRPALHGDAIANPNSLFPDGRPADILHAWTPRENVRRFVTAWQARHPTPWVIYLEDNEDWIARAAMVMAGLPEEDQARQAESVISAHSAQALSHVLRYRDFIGLADGAVVIQDRLAVEVPSWVPVRTVMPGVDLAAFGRSPADPALRSRLGVAANERVIVYPGGLNDFTRPGLEALCLAVARINESGTPCRLLRSGPVPLDFLDKLPQGAARFVTELGVLPRESLPGLLALADALVQPGKSDPFEDLRLPGKLPEFLASGRPVVMPDANIAGNIQDGVEALLHRTGTPDEIAQACLALFADPALSRRIGEGGRRFAEANFDPARQSARLLEAFHDAIERHDSAVAARAWQEGDADEPVASRLVRKLRGDAAAKGDGGRALATAADLVERAAQRARGLEEGIALAQAGIARRDTDIAVLQRENAIRDGIIDALRQDVAGLRRDVAERDLAIAAREARIAAMEGSLSWRITGPLRALVKLLRGR